MRSPLCRAPRRALVLLALLCATLLGGCASTTVEQQVAPGEASFRTIDADEALGQTFVVRHDGLAGISLVLRPDTPGEGALIAELLPARGAAPLAQSSLPVAAVDAQRAYELPFAASLASRQRDYFLALRVEGAGAVQAAVMPADSYREGSLYAGDAPVDGQLVHGLVFAQGPRLLGFLARLAWYAWLLLIGLLVLALPGMGLLAALESRGTRRGLVERVALGVGISVALAPLLMLWARLAGVALGPWNAWLPALIGAGLLAWRSFEGRPSPPAPLPRGEGSGKLSPLLAEGGSRQPSPLTPLLAEGGSWKPSPRGRGWGEGSRAVVLALLLLIVATRLAAVGALEAPQWGDAYQHAMMAQLMLDNGGLFDSWAPYVPYVTMTNQFGFPAVAAVLGWAAGLDGVEATIVAGQLLNAAAALALYPIATRVAGGHPLAGLVAVLVAGLLSPIPGFYVNWGRYAQLAGLVILPAAMLLTWELAAQKGRAWPLAALLGLVVAGLLLAYYRMAFFYAAFVGALLLCWGLPTWGRDGRAWVGGLGRLALAASCSLALFAPWALHVRSSNLAETMQLAAQQGTPLSYIQSDYAAWGLLPQVMPPWLIAVALVGLAWGAARRAWMLLAMAIWLVPPAGYMATSLFGVPGAVMLQSFAVVITVYIPVAVAWGWVGAELVDHFLCSTPIALTPAAGAASPSPACGRGGQGVRAMAPPVTSDPLVRSPGLRASRSLALSLVLLPLALWGAWGQLRIVDPAYALVTRPDRNAMAWVQREAPPDARFLVQGFTVYAGQTAVGADAGWWLSLLGRRENTMPPQYALANERPVPPDYTARVVALVHALNANPVGTPESIAALCAEGITHIYHGQGQGRVGNAAQPLFTPAELEASPQFSRVYAEDRVRIYAFDRGVCS